MGDALAADVVQERVVHRADGAGRAGSDNGSKPEGTRKKRSAGERGEAVRGEHLTPW